MPHRSADQWSADEGAAEQCSALRFAMTRRENLRLLRRGGYYPPAWRSYAYVCGRLIAAPTGDGETLSLTCRKRHPPPLGEEQAA